MENWRSIIEFEDYQISDLGRVKITANTATRKERILKPLNHPRGYFRVALWKNNKPKFMFIHRLVAIHFIPNPENKKTINHKDGNKSNNAATNLEWNTYRENMNHSILSGLSASGERNGRSKITKVQAEEIKTSNLSSQKLAEIYGIHKSNINRIKRNEGWK